MTFILRKAIGNKEYNVHFDDHPTVNEFDSEYVLFFVNQGFESFMVTEKERCACCQAFTKELDILCGIHAYTAEEAIEIFIKNKETN